jgi:hypothetical protein
VCRDDLTLQQSASILGELWSTICAKSTTISEHDQVEWRTLRDRTVGSVIASDKQRADVNEALSLP